MTKQLATAVIAAVAVAGSVVYKLNDGSLFAVKIDTVDCTYQPPGLRAPPCLSDGGFNLKFSDYIDAGCLAQVCPRYAEIIDSGKSQFFLKPVDVRTRGKSVVDTKPVDEKPVDVQPVDAVPAAEVRIEVVE